MEADPAMSSATWCSTDALRVHQCLSVTKEEACRENEAVIPEGGHTRGHGVCWVWGQSLRPR